jgi:hypothetical protein
MASQKGENLTMKRDFSAVLLLMAIISLAAFFGCSNAPNNSATAVPTPTAEPTPDTVAIKTELTRLENDWPRIIKERDGATVRRVEADDVMIVYPDGSIGNKEQDAKDIEAGLVTFDSWDTSDLKINVLDKDSAVVTLRYTVKNAKLKGTGGRTTDISGQYISLDTFARRNGQWQFVALSSVKVQSPVSTASPTPMASPSASVPAAPKPSPTTRTSPVTKSTPTARPSAPRPSPARATVTP